MMVGLPIASMSLHVKQWGGNHKISSMGMVLMAIALFPGSTVMQALADIFKTKTQFNKKTGILFDMWDGEYLWIVSFFWELKVLWNLIVWPLIILLLILLGIVILGAILTEVVKKTYTWIKKLFSRRRHR
ncbi:MAG TPA: hypothetical protein PK295_05050 [Candidatus Magasanikbacteria bacterium]|nr:hypothetical protein [Candidatus Magasanikbacteria bacterium]